MRRLRRVFPRGGRRRFFARLLLGLTLGLGSGGAPCLRAQSDASAPAVAVDAVVAAYLVNFIRFTDWPPGAEAGLPPEAPLVIGVHGDRAVEDRLLEVAETTRVRGRRLRIEVVRQARDLEGCHLVFFGPGFERGGELDAETDDARAKLLERLAGRPVLTVGAKADFLAEGGMVNLYREGSMLRFEIAAGRAEAAGLALDARLRALARPAPRSEAEQKSEAEP
jgi:hypothetical protein